MDIARSNNFTVLVAALERAGLNAVLRGTGPFTVFAPTDAAFGTLLQEQKITQQQLLGDAGLADYIRYHVVAGKVGTALEQLLFCFMEPGLLASLLSKEPSKQRALNPSELH